MPEPTATAMMEETGIRPREEWTVENPATREEIEAELEQPPGQQPGVQPPGAAHTRRRNGRHTAFLSNEQFGIDIIDDNQLRSWEKSGLCRNRVTFPGTSSTKADGHDTHPWEKTGSLEDLDFSIIDNS